MNSEGRRFSVTLPDWGQDHLSPEAVVAFVDDELDDGPFLRATRHLDSCNECATQVSAQGQARLALRSAECPSLPSSLMSSLFSIPQDTELPGAPAGLAVTSDGQFVSVLRPERVRPEQAAPAGLAPDSDHGRRPPSRRMRFGAGAAMSGLAIGAMALGATGISSDASTSVAGPERGVFDGPVLGGSPVDARLRIAPTDADSAAELELMPHLPAAFLRKP